MPVLALPSTEVDSLADAVATAVRDGIAAGELIEGEVYSVYQLADLLGVSRSPVREALLRLAEAGLVEIARNRGFRVLLPRAHDVEEIFEIRLALEPAAVRRVADRADDEARHAIATHLSTMREATGRLDHASFWAADHALHDAILHASGNARAAAIVAHLRATTALLGPPTTATGRSLRQIHDEHAPIVEAVLAGDGPGAEDAMRQHLERTGLLLVAGMSAAPAASPAPRVAALARGSRRPPEALPQGASQR